MPLIIDDDRKKKTAAGANVAASVQRTVKLANQRVGARSKAKAAGVYTPPRSATSTKWYTGDKPASRDIAAQIYRIGETDSASAQQKYAEYQQFTADPASPIYNPYTQATSKAVAALGIDRTTGIDGAWFDANAGMKRNYRTSATGTSPLAPAKNSTQQQDNAYWYDRAWDDEQTTVAAENEWSALQKDVAFWATSGRNYSDDEVLEKIDWSKYPTLKKMDEGRAIGQPLQLTRPVGYSEDALYGVVWGARNPELSSGDAWTDSVQYALGRGKSYTRNDATVQALDPTSSRYAPYTVGSTMDAEMSLFGVERFDKDWLSANRDRIITSGTPEEKAAFARVVKAVKDTDELEAQATSFNAAAANAIAAGMKPGDVMRLLDAPEYSGIRGLYDAMYTGEPKPVSRAINFDPNRTLADATSSYAATQGKAGFDVAMLAISAATGVPIPQADPIAVEIGAAQDGEIDAVRPAVAQYGTDIERAAAATFGSEYATVLAQSREAVLGGTATAAQTNLATQNGVVDNVVSGAFESWSAYEKAEEQALASRPAILDTLGFGADELPSQREVEERVAEYYRSGDPEKRQAAMSYRSADEMAAGNMAMYFGSVAQLDELEAEADGYTSELAEAYGGEGTPEYKAAKAYLDLVYAYREPVRDEYQFAAYGEYDTAMRSGGASSVTAAFNNNASNILQLNDAIAWAKEHGADETMIENMEARRDILVGRNNEIAERRAFANDPDVAAAADAFDAQYRAPEDGVYYGAMRTADDVIRDAVVLRSAGNTNITSSFANTEEAAQVANLEAVPFMTDYEVSRYKKLYVEDGPQAASEYFYSLEPRLNARQAADETERITEFGKRHPVVGQLVAILESPLQAFGTIYSVLEGASGREIDPNNPAYMFTRLNQSVKAGGHAAIEENAGDNLWGDVLTTLYDAATSVGESIMAGAVGTPGGATGLMSSYAFNAGVMDAKARGGTNGEALLYGAAVAGAEYLTERLPMEKLFDAFKAGKAGGGLKNILIDALPEGLGEGASEILGRVADDAIMGGMSNYELSVQRYMDEENLGEKEARAAAERDFWRDVLMSTATGYVSGAGTVGIGYAAGKLAGGGNTASVTSETGTSEATATETEIAEAPAAETQPVEEQDGQGKPSAPETQPAAASSKATAVVASVKIDKMGVAKAAATIAGAFEAMGFAPAESTAAGTALGRSRRALNTARRLLTSSSDTQATMRGIAMGMLAPNSQCAQVLTGKGGNEDLAAAYQSDTQNADVMRSYATTVHTSSVATAVMPSLAQDADAVVAANEAAESASENAKRMAQKSEEAQARYDSAVSAVKKAQEAVAAEPSESNIAAAVEAVKTAKKAKTDAERAADAKAAADALATRTKAKAEQAARKALGKARMEAEAQVTADEQAAVAEAHVDSNDQAAAVTAPAGASEQSETDTQTQVETEQQTDGIDAQQATEQQEVESQRIAEEAQRIAYEEVGADDAIEAAEAADDERAATESEDSAWKQEYRAKQKARAQRNADKGAIIKIAKRLARAIANPTKKNHVTVGIDKAVVEFLAALNLGQKPKSAAELGQKIKDVAAAFNSQPEYASMFTVAPEMETLMKELSAKVAGAGNMMELDAESMHDLATVVKFVNHCVRTQNKAFSKAVAAAPTSIARDTVSELAARRTSTRGSVKEKLSSVRYSLMNAFTYFDVLGDGSKPILAGLRDGVDTMVELFSDVKTKANNIANQYMQRVGKREAKKLFKGKNAPKHDVTFGGKTAQMTKAEIMTLMNAFGDEDGRRHILNGGIKIGNEVYKPTESDVQAAFVLLGEAEVELANNLQQAMAQDGGKMLNEASAQMRGYTTILSPTYWHLEVDKNTVSKEDETSNARVNSIMEIGAAKERTKGANNPVVVRDVFDVYTSHMGDIVTYKAVGPAVADGIRWYYAPGVRTEMERTMGKEGMKWFETLLRDFKGATPVGNDTFGTSKRFGLAKAANVGASINVAIQQVTALPDALTQLAGKYLMAGLSIRPSEIKSAYAKVLKYCPIAKWKDYGFFEAHIGRNTRDLLFEQGTQPLEKVRSAQMEAAAAGDRYNFSVLWRACEAEVKAMHGDLTGEALDIAVGQRLAEVVDRTQVVDSPLHRTQAMRSQNAFVKMATAFGSEPAKKWNQWEQAFEDWRKNPKSKLAKKRVADTAKAYVLSATLNAVVVSLYGAVKDEDEDETFAEKFGEALFGDYSNAKAPFDYVGAFLASNLGSNLNPLNMIPLAKDAVSFAQGYDPSRMDLEAIANAMTVVAQLLKVFSGGGSTWTAAKWVYSVADAIGTPLGIGAGNAVRDLATIANGLSRALTGENIVPLKADSGFGKQTVKLLNAVLRNDTDHFERIVTDLTNEGKTPAEIDSAFAIEYAASDPRAREAWELRENGDVVGNERTKETMISELAPFFGEERAKEIVDKAVVSFRPKKETSKDPNKRLDAVSFTAEDVAGVVMNVFGFGDGESSVDDFRLAMSEAMADSTAQDPSATVKSNVRAKLKPLYIAACADGEDMSALNEFLKTELGMTDETLARWTAEAFTP